MHKPCGVCSKARRKATFQCPLQKAKPDEHTGYKSAATGGECVDSLGFAATFSTIDCNSAYLQIEIPDADRDRTTFSRHNGLFLFFRMLFGLKNASASFQRAVDSILSKVK